MSEKGLEETQSNLSEEVMTGVRALFGGKIDFLVLGFDIEEFPKGVELL